MSNAAKKLEMTEAESAHLELLDLRGKVAALERAQATIEFNLDGTIITANENFLHTLQYTLNEIRGQHHRMFCDSAETSNIAYKKFWEKLARGEFNSGEYKRFRKDGAEVWLNASYNPVFDENGKPYKVIKFATDITEQKNKNAEYSAMISAISKVQAVIEFNLDGTIISANENFLNVTGYNLSEIENKHHRIFCEPAYAASPEYKLFWEKLNRGEFDTGEYRRIGKGGKEVWIKASYNPIINGSGKPFKVVKYATDISQQIAISVALAENSALLAAASAELTATATEMENISDQTSKQSLLASESTEEILGGMQTVSTNMEEMVLSIKEIARSTSESSQMAKTTLMKTKETNETITHLGVSSQEIGDVIKVISSIAQQTNLLALNATIEAARAGDAGRGFAVVANEVKELAKQTAKATNDITNKIGAIQKDTQKAVEAIGGISDAVEKLNGISGVIATAVEEQTATTNEVSRVVLKSKKDVENVSSTVKLVSSAAGESKISSSQTLTAAKDLSVLADKLNGLVKKSS